MLTVRDHSLSLATDCISGARALFAMHFLAFLSVIVATSVASFPTANEARADDGTVEVRIQKPVIEAFCEAVFPLKLTGRKKVSVTVLGQTASQEIPWTATVDSPEIVITGSEQSFVAHAQARTPGLPAITWDDRVSGRLEAVYDFKRKAVIVRAKNAIARIVLGPLEFDLDVSKDIPELVLQLQLPDVPIPSGRSTVKVDVALQIDFEKDAIVVTGTPMFRKTKADPDGE